MKRWFSMLVVALSCIACAPAADDSTREDESLDSVEESNASLIASPIDPVALDPAPGPLLPGWGADTGGTSELGKNKCTSERQMNCDACVDGCDYLCDRANGGGQAGGCVGLFCPTRCESCVLGCYKACGKCTPSQF